MAERPRGFESHSHRIRDHADGGLAASTAFTSPVGYQTSLFVYGAGGYDSDDHLRVGGPLQALPTVVTTLGVAVFWGV